LVCSDNELEQGLEPKGLWSFYIVHILSQLLPLFLGVQGFDVNQGYIEAAKGMSVDPRSQ
jgi:hypothetical protein